MTDSSYNSLDVNLFSCHKFDALLYTYLHPKVQARQALVATPYIEDLACLIIILS